MYRTHGPNEMGNIQAGMQVPRHLHAYGLPWYKMVRIRLQCGSLVPSWVRKVPCGSVAAAHPTIVLWRNPRTGVWRALQPKGSQRLRATELAAQPALEGGVVYQVVRSHRQYLMMVLRASAIAQDEQRSE